MAAPAEAEIVAVPTALAVSVPLVALTVTLYDPAVLLTASVNVAVPVAPEAMLSDEAENVPVKPVG